MLNKFELLVAKEDAERVDTLRYTWERMSASSVDVINNLILLQPEFKNELVDNVLIFGKDCDTFYSDYRNVSNVMIFVRGMELGLGRVECRGNLVKNLQLNFKNKLVNNV